MMFAVPGNPRRREGVFYGAICRVLIYFMRLSTPALASRMPRLDFVTLPRRYAACRLAAGSGIPDWVSNDTFSCVARTDDELSVIARSDKVPQGVRAERGLTGFRIAGTLEFTETGILSEVAGLLADAGIPVLAVSTFDTDYFFVRTDRMSRVRAILRAAGHAFPDFAGAPYIKICCIASQAEAEVAVELGASALGLVSRMPSGPGVISEALIASIAAAVAGRVETVLLTSETEPAKIAEQVTQTGVSGVQLCSWLDEDARSLLRNLLPGTMLMQVVHVTDEAAVEKAWSAQRYVDRLLLDSGTLTGPILELGGTGRTHDWTISRTIVETVEVPVLLAGGLKPDNVAEALAAVGPFGLDVCSGVRSEGRLDRELLTAFFDVSRSKESTHGAADADAVADPERSES